MSYSQKAVDIYKNACEQIHCQKDIVKSKLKIYGVQKKIDSDLTGLGDVVFSCFEDGKKAVWEDEAVLMLIEEIREQREDIKKEESVIDGIKKDADSCLKALKCKAKDFLSECKDAEMGCHVNGDEADVKAAQDVKAEPVEEAAKVEEEVVVAEEKKSDPKNKKRVSKERKPVEKKEKAKKKVNDSEGINSEEMKRK